MQNIWMYILGLMWLCYFYISLNLICSWNNCECSGVPVVRSLWYECDMSSAFTLLCLWVLSSSPDFEDQVFCERCECNLGQSIGRGGLLYYYIILLLLLILVEREHGVRYRFDLMCIFALLYWRLFLKYCQVTLARYNLCWMQAIMSLQWCVTAIYLIDRECHLLYWLLSNKQQATECCIDPCFGH